MKSAGTTVVQPDTGGIRDPQTGEEEANVKHRSTFNVLTDLDTQQNISEDVSDEARRKLEELSLRPTSASNTAPQKLDMEILPTEGSSRNGKRKYDEYDSDIENQTQEFKYSIPGKPDKRITIKERTSTSIGTYFSNSLSSSEEDLSEIVGKNTVISHYRDVHHSSNKIGLFDEHSPPVIELGNVESDRLADPLDNVSLDLGTPTQEPVLKDYFQLYDKLLEHIGIDMLEKTEDENESDEFIDDDE